MESLGPEPSALGELPEATRRKWDALLDALRGLGSAVTAFSGGVDSGLLSAAAYFALAERMLAVTVDSPVNPQGETETARELARQLGFAHRVVPFDDLENPDFKANPPGRCYFCKLERLRLMVEVARAEGFAAVLEGSNTDDASDYRPGMRAVSELGVLSPLAAAGLSKSEIRSLAKALHLPIWDRPSAPCLATRFPYGTPITPEGIRQVDQAEAYLHAHGFSVVRVRHLGDAARIEVPPQDLARLIALRAELVDIFKSLGFRYISADLQGYRQGALNEGLSV